MTQKRRRADSGKAIRETTALRWEPTHVTKPNPVRATGAPDSRRILSNITVYNYDTTHLQENPQRLG